MFIISHTYKGPLELADPYLKAHAEFLNKQYEPGNFLASGRKAPRTGGIILSTVADKNELVKIIEEDPFKKNQLADYERQNLFRPKPAKSLNFC